MQIVDKFARKHTFSFVALRKFYLDFARLFINLSLSFFLSFVSRHQLTNDCAITTKFNFSFELNLQLAAGLSSPLCFFLSIVFFGVVFLTKQQQHQNNSKKKKKKKTTREKRDRLD